MASPVYGELLIRPASGHATLLHHFLYVIDSKRALSFGEAQMDYVRSYLRITQARPTVVKNYFCERHVRYAAT